MDLQLKLLWLLCFYFKIVPVSFLLPTQIYILPLHTQGLLSIHLNKLQPTVNPSEYTTAIVSFSGLGINSS